METPEGFSAPEKKTKYTGWGYLANEVELLREDLKVAMQKILETDPESKCEFIERPVVDLPQIDESTLQQNFGDVPKARAALAKINEFLHYPRIKDKFGLDSEPDQSDKRRTWRKQMMNKYGDLFNKVYRKNQFVGNQITIALAELGRLRDLSKKKGNLDLSNQLRTYTHKLVMLYHGTKINGERQHVKSYIDMDYAEKEHFLDNLEAQLREAVSIIS